jgi:16S rRNA (cytidine1402-2'-O)-methyltransferase
MSGILYIVATPIGNLEDITFRAIKVLNKVDIILAEDTRVTSKLAVKYNLRSVILGYHQHSPDSKKLEILRYLTEGKNIALVTDAGTPGISDPGNELIAFLFENNPEIKFVPIPGPSAIITSLSIAGFDVNKFVFIGFMPKKKKEKLLRWLNDGKITFSYYDSPHRVVSNLIDIKKVLGEDAKVFVARELTKIYETVYRGKIGEVINDLENKPIKGEIVVVVSRKM